DRAARPRVRPAAREPCAGERLRHRGRGVRGRARLAARGRRRRAVGGGTCLEPDPQGRGELVDQLRVALEGMLPAVVYPEIDDLAAAAVDVGGGERAAAT